MCKILKLYSIPEKYINVFKALNRNLSYCIRTREGLTNVFDTVSGVKQDCILAPFLFLMVIDFVIRKTMENKYFGIIWDHRRPADVDFADDLALLDHTHEALQDMTNRLHGLGKKVGLRISNRKTKTMTVGKQHFMPPITVDNQNIKNVHKFQYLGNYMAKDGDV